MSSDHWCTGEPVLSLLDDFFEGRLLLDPCSNARSLVKAKKAYTAGGLHLPWKKTTYANVPYSKILPWVEKGAREVVVGNVGELIYLLPVATSTVWWKRATGLEPIPSLAKGGKEITTLNPTLIFPKRLAFLDHNGKPVQGARFDSVLFFFCTKEKRHKDFLHAFAPLINWSTRGR